ncbi:MAG: D-ala-D-ala transporter subunit [Candidatus Marinimicrobia bacterium]|nr:D-ala-D-ala transporter subunit [Candidatus Neomarinimicrobiota bacterium]
MFRLFSHTYMNRTSRIALLFIILIIVSSILVQFVSPYADDLNGAVHLEIGGQPPSIKHWFGTDAAGRDLFTLTIYAGLSSLKVAFSVVLLSIVIGVPIGMFSGVSTRNIDEVLMRITDGFLAFPPLMLPLIITSVLGPSLNNVIIGISMSWFPWYVRIARSQAMIILSSGYVSVSKSMGAGKLHIIKKHIFPNSIGPILVQGTIDAGYAILTASGLSFIGLCARHPEVEWGLLITQSRAQFLNHWWEVLFPGLFIIFTVISFNVIGDELRKLTNPKELK